MIPWKRSTEGAPISKQDLLESFTARYQFPLDDFQLRAIRAILDGKSVIVSAPTGAGKTLVAEFAIHRALAHGRRLAYTTPLKALSNQKFADFGRQFGADQVGILTGDVKVNARAPILVMTTEILRNMFYTGGLPGLETVVLDECHYMGDEGRGTVWEEIIVNAPKDAGLVALVRHRRQRGGDRRLDRPRPPAHRGHHAPAPAGAAPVPRGRPLRRAARLRGRARGHGASHRRGARPRGQ